MFIPVLTTLVDVRTLLGFSLLVVRAKKHNDKIYNTLSMLNITASFFLMRDVSSN